MQKSCQILAISATSFFSHLGPQTLVLTILTNKIVGSRSFFDLHPKCTPEANFIFIVTKM